MSTILLKDEEEAKYFTKGDHPDFEHVETVKDYDALYKDYCPATTFATHAETGKFYALDWQSCESHYGVGEDIFNELSVYEVQQAERIIVKKEWVKV